MKISRYEDRTSFFFGRLEISVALTSEIVPFFFTTMAVSALLNRVLWDRKSYICASSVLSVGSESLGY